MCEERFLSSSPFRTSMDEDFNPPLNKSPTVDDFQLFLINHSDFHMLKLVNTYSKLLGFPIINSLQKY